MAVTPFIFLPAPQNSIRLYKQNNAIAPIYTIKPFDLASYDQHTLSTQLAYPYQQKAKFGDQQTIMLHTQYEEGAGAFKPYLEIINSSGDVVFTITTDPLYYKGQVINENFTYTAPASTTTYPLKSDLFAFKFGQLFDNISANTGVYYIRVTNTHSSLPYEIWISEPIFLYDDYPNTILIEANNNSNKDYWIINGWDNDYIPTSSIRVEGNYKSLVNNAYIKQYRKQNFLLNQTTSYNWRQFELHLGDTSEGIPEYMLDSITNILLMDNLKIENKYFVLKKDGNDDGSVLNVKDPKTVPLMTATGIIEEKYVYANAISNNTLTLFTLSELEALGAAAITPFKMSDGIDVISFDHSAFYTTTDIDNYVEYINTTVIPAEGITGYAYRNDYSVVYRLGEGELFNSVYSEYYDDFLYNKFLRIPMVNPSYSGGAATKRRLNIDLSDALYPNIGTPYIVTDNGTGQVLFRRENQHDYVQLDGTENPIVHIFFKDDISWMYFNSIADSTYAKIQTLGSTTIQGSFPNVIKLLRFLNQDMQNFNIPALKPSLIFFAIENCSVYTLERLFNGVNLPNLSIIAIQNLGTDFRNNLTSTDTDYIFNDFNSSTPTHPSSGSRYILVRNFITPLAPPTSASLAARSALATAGYIISTD